MHTDPTELDAHFKFGENWKSFVGTVGREEVASAAASLGRLLTEDDLRNQRFLDIGCGSGLSMVAAAALGADTVHGIDIDPQSVAAAGALLGRHLDPSRYSVEVLSVLDDDIERLGAFGVVHSWGVLHHTGDMWAAVRRASSLVAPGGLFAIALYRKTPACGFWRLEKRIYAHATPRVQRLIRTLYQGIYRAGLRLTGRDFAGYVAAYRRDRGMDWSHDVHDWLGGYPYESTTPSEVIDFLKPFGFTAVRVREKSARLWGLLGSHCDEVVVRKSQDGRHG